MFKIRISQDALRYENFGRLRRKEFKKMTNEAMKKSKIHICLGVNNSKAKPKILTAMIALNISIMAYYM